VARIVARIGALMLEYPQIREIDLNPMVVFEEGRGAIALDALMVID